MTQYIKRNWNSLCYPLRVTILFTSSILILLGDHFLLRCDNKRQFSMEICLDLLWDNWFFLSLVNTPSGSLLFHFFIKSVEFLLENILFFRFWIILLEGDNPVLQFTFLFEVIEEVSMDLFIVLLGDLEYVFQDCVLVLPSLYRELLH